MALYLPVRAHNRSSKLRIDGQVITPTATVYIDISKATVRKEFASHSTLGQVYVVGPVAATTNGVVVVTGATTTAQGTPDQTVAVAAGELLNRTTLAYVTVVANAALAASAAHATLARKDIVQVHTGTGVVSYKAGTAAATPLVPSPDASNIAIAIVARAATDNTIATGDITDTRVRG